MLKPDILKMAINNDINIKRAKALLSDRWDEIYEDSPFVAKMSVNDVNLAKQLLKNHIFNNVKIDFADYKSVHDFVINNEKYMDQLAKTALLADFQ
ncbi:hypothetical protein AKUA2003_06930 [Apilactobacillus kunkeei]|nr:hypothetical protein AKUA1001_06950 [Apilactobacillus kunkeei]CAI2596360.1 hypothetical protein AKUA2003_06930 [Apilactobacillus kunkeei]CAI2802160.1 hypothetical protein AKUA2002_06930 [Apilactobacillus kunkeei]